MPPPPDLEAIAAGLRDTFPDAAPIAPCRLIGVGFNSIAVETASGVIFRIARTEGSAERYAIEAQLLPLLRPLLPVEVPRPRWLAASAPSFPLGVMGYPKLSGEPLSPSLDSVEMGRVAADVASVLLALQRVPVADLGALALPGRSERRAHLLSLRDDVLPALRERLAAGEFRRIESWWAAFFENRRMNQYEAVLCHGDFWFANILVGGDPMRVSGVVDWEHACLGDPALDFATLLHMGEAFAAATIDAFRALGGALDDGFMRRMRRLWELREFYGVLYAVQFDDAEEMRDSLAKLRRGPVLSA